MSAHDYISKVGSMLKKGPLGSKKMDQFDDVEHSLVCLNLFCNNQGHRRRSHQYHGLVLWSYSGSLSWRAKRT